ncbi:MAG TPA: DUF3618 domain-containing protein [Pseudonocardia sp.]|jgi:hypothetical protein|nr:DUF3618 domain-containing protein [Pseudonocardia sp.]
MSAPKDAAAGDPATKSPEELRAEVGVLRTEVADTVQELAERADVPARVRARRDDTAEQVRLRVARARRVLAEKAPAVDRAIDEQPLLVAGAVVVIMWLLLRRR